MAMQVKDSNRVRRSLGVAFVIMLLLHLAVVPNVGIAGGRANLMLVLAACAALSTGGDAGVVTGFVTGLAFDLTTTGPVGLMALELTIANLVLGRETRNRLTDDPQGSFRAFVLCALAVELAYGLAMLVVGSATGIVEVLVARTLPSIVLDCVAFAIVHALVRRVGRGGSSFSGVSGPRTLGGKRLRTK